MNHFMMKTSEKVRWRRSVGENISEDILKDKYYFLLIYIYVMVLYNEILKRLRLVSIRFLPYPRNRFFLHLSNKKTISTDRIPY